MKHPAGKFILKTITFKPYKSKEEEKNDWLLFFRSFKTAISNLGSLFVKLCLVVALPIISIIISIANLFQDHLDSYEAGLWEYSSNPFRLCIGIFRNMYVDVDANSHFIRASLYSLLGIVTLIRAPFRSLRTHLSGGYTGYRNIWESESFQKVEDAARVVVANSSADDIGGTEANYDTLCTFIYKAQKAVYFQRPGAEQLQGPHLRDHMHFINIRDSAIRILSDCDRARADRRATPL